MLLNHKLMLYAVFCTDWQVKWTIIMRNMNQWKQISTSQEKAKQLWPFTWRAAIISVINTWASSKCEFETYLYVALVSTLTLKSKFIAIIPYFMSFCRFSRCCVNHLITPEVGKLTRCKSWYTAVETLQAVKCF